MTVAITRKELGAVELRREARRWRDTAGPRRMLALVREGGLARGSGAGGRHGPADAPGLGAPLRRRGPRRPTRPAPVGTQAAPHTNGPNCWPVWPTRGG